jgi:hypothetical protein
MKDIAIGYCIMASIMSITVLEIINMFTLHHNGNILILCIITISGLGGYSVKSLEVYIMQKYGLQIIKNKKGKK